MSSSCVRLSSCEIASSKPGCLRSIISAISFALLMLHPLLDLRLRLKNIFVGGYAHSMLFDYGTVLQNPGARRFAYNSAAQDIRERLPLPLRRKNRYRLFLRGKIQRDPQHTQGMLPVARCAICLFRPRHKYIKTYFAHIIPQNTRRAHTKIYNRFVRAHLRFSPCVLRLETTGTTGKNNLERGARANSPASYRVPRRNAPVARCTWREAIRFPGKARSFRAAKVARGCAIRSGERSARTAKQPQGPARGGKEDAVFMSCTSCFQKNL